MTESTTIVAFDQHAATTVAGVLLPGHRTPAIQTLTSAAEVARPQPVGLSPYHGRAGAHAFLYFSSERTWPREQSHRRAGSP